MPAQIALGRYFGGNPIKRASVDRADASHTVGTLIGQRVFGIALGYEYLNDHDELRHDPLMAVLAGKLKARREDCAPVAGKSTLNRLELSRNEPSRYHKIAHDAAAIEAPSACRQAAQLEIVNRAITRRGPSS